MLLKIKNKDTLIIDDFRFRCCVGRNGVKKNKREGDGCTPKGTFKVINVFYRSDKLNKIKSGIPVFEIKRKYRWCTDPRNHNYNSLIVGKTSRNYENLYRDDDIYDLVVVLNYNLRKKKYKGSAIFIHCKSKENKFTEGCIGIEKEQLMQIIRSLTPLTRFIIS